MKKTIKTQSQLDNLSPKFSDEIVVIGGTTEEPITIDKVYENATLILSDNAVVILKENSQVEEMWGNSQVKEMRENSQVNLMRENSQVNLMWGNSQVKEMRENSQVNLMRENSQVKEMWGNSQVKEMWENSICKVYSSTNKISCFGFNYIFIPNNVEDIGNIVLNNTSQIIRFDTFQSNPTIDFYLKNYKIAKKTQDILILYKAVHKTEKGNYFSNYDNKFLYEIGKTYHNLCDKDNNSSCNVGLHVGDLNFAKQFGYGWADLAIIEVEVPIAEIVVAKDCDGKIRTSTLIVIRELDKSEYE
jgi:hypothetical protein